MSVPPKKPFTKPGAVPAKPGVKPAVKPAAAPAKPMVKPAAAPAKPMPKLAPKPMAKPAGKPMAKPAAKPAAQAKVVKMDENAIREMAYDFSQQPKSYDDFVWLLAENELRLIKAYTTPSN